ncbi:thioredoxin reductase (NADPH) [Atopostipes suicloacalis DSM 15692]|uniref:Ferredoxin--NADP reductase n=1 Tax=Atopostipes suicloacalis DSM 15692 TaxID=1121025 RepID=A0A1M4Z0W5_9LACT|nr:NAD(P)/FAD-dependent oxidoreductase [Atopostipes suicloacalis]SHF11694.1 thioredoxin reductase (NADPH) [Atopostipes suicloacalis DSM 15692]
MQAHELYDVIIIGGGPTGMFSAFYAGMRELKTKIIETLPVLGGQIEVMYPEKNIFDIGAFPYIKGSDLIQQLSKQMAPFETDICLEENVLEVIKKEDYFLLKTNKGIHYAKTILITTGQGSFDPRKLTLEHNEQYEKTDIHYYVKELKTYQDKNVVICGGGDSAVDWALTLKDVAKSVSIVHRRNKFRALEASVTLMKDSTVDIFTPYRPIELLGDGEKIQEVRFQETRGKQTFTLPTDYLIVSYGFISDNRQLEEWGLETEHASVKVSQRMETNIPGIYAAGDVATYDGKVKLIATGFGEAPTAINSIIQYLNPESFIQAPLSADMAEKFSDHFSDPN